MSLFASSSLITSVLSFSLALFVIYKNKKSSLNRSWFLVSFFMGIWSFALWGVVSATAYRQALLFQYLLDVSAIFIPIFYFKFTITLLKLKERKKYQLLFFYLAGFALAIISFFPIFKLGMKQLYDFNYWINPGLIYPIFPIYFSALMIYSFYLTVKNFNKFSSTEKGQIKYVLFAGVVGFIGGSTDFFPQLINIYPIGNYFVILYIVLVTYAILKYRLMGIRMIISKLYVYFFLGSYAYSAFYLISFFEENYLGGIYSAKSLMLGAFLAVLFAMAMLPLLDIVQKSSDVLFYRGHNPRSILKDLALKLSSVIDLDELLGILAAEFKKILATEEIDVYLFQKEKEGNGACYSVLLDQDKKLAHSHIICQTVTKEKKVIVRDEIEREGKKSLVKEMDKLKAKVLAPLILRGRAIGLILLGEKIAQDAYNQEDIEFLEIISSQAAVAITNAQLYQEIEEFNRTLQQKVDEQTKDIKEKADRLRKLMEMRSEFLDITSHQLRTPVSVIKGVLSMMEEGTLPPKKRKEFLRGALEKSIKLGEIINDILRASEMDSDKFSLNLKPIDLKPIMEKIAKDKKQTSEIKKVKLIFIFPKEPLPLVLADERYLEQAIVNLINNSFQYTLKGVITVTTAEEKNSVVVRVIDTGIGIPKEDQGKLFQKFGRAENAIATYTDGSGLGLFIVKQIVDAIPGAKIYIEKTEVGKGTTFALALPIAKK